MKRITSILILIAGLAAVSTASAASVQSVAPVHSSARASASAATHTPRLPVPVYNTQAKLSGRASEYSYNWAGYVTVPRSGRYRGVSANFTVPYVSTLSWNGSAGNMASHWVGLDGYNTGSIEQDGIGEYYDPALGLAYSFTWWELYPANAMQALFYVQPGDRISASVMYHEGSYWQDGRPAFEMNITDRTSGDRYSNGWRPNAYTPRRTNAEVITEVPATDAGVFALTNYGNERFTSSSAYTMGYRRHSMGSDSTQRSHRVLLVNGGQQSLAGVSSLTNHGFTFSTPYRRGY